MTKKGDILLEKLGLELKLRGFSIKTVEAYLSHNKRFLNYIKKEPDHITQDDVKQYLAHLISDKQQRPSSITLALSSLKFLYKEIMKKDIFVDIRPPKSEKKIPTVLTKDEVKRLLAVIKSSKHRLLIEFMYSSGLRVSECVSLKIDDLDLGDETGTIRSGKGKKDRHIILSKNLIVHLNKYLSKRTDVNPYIFNIRDTHICTRQAQRVVSDAAKLAGIRKRVFCHALRSSFATHLLDAGTDIRVIQELLGHSNLSTTERYTKVSKEKLKEVKSPFDAI